MKRGLIEIVEEPVEFTVAGKSTRPSPLDFQFNSAQQDALKRIEDSVCADKFSGMLTAWRHWVGQDCGLSGGDAIGARGGTVGDPAGS